MNECGKYLAQQIYRRIITFNPAIHAFLKKSGEIYARTLAQPCKVYRAWFQAASGKASSAISGLVDEVRSNLDGVAVTDTRVLLPSHAYQPHRWFLSMPLSA